MGHLGIRVTEDRLESKVIADHTENQVIADNLDSQIIAGLLGSQVIVDHLMSQIIVDRLVSQVIVDHESKVIVGHLGNQIIVDHESQVIVDPLGNRIIVDRLENQVIEDNHVNRVINQGIPLIIIEDVNYIKGETQIEIFKEDQDLQAMVSNNSTGDLIMHHKRDKKEISLRISLGKDMVLIAIDSNPQDQNLILNLKKRN